MSASTIMNGGFNFDSLNPGRGSSQSAPGSSSGTGGLLSSVALSLANFQSQTLGSLLGSASGDNANDANSFSALLAAQKAAPSHQASVAGSTEASTLSATGRNTSLFDPESGYQMMSVINNDDVAYKAEFSEMGQMKSYVAEMQQDGASLGSIDAATGNDSIKTQLQQFAGQYNDWVQRFDPDMQSGGILAGTQAAQVSRYELDRSVENMFNGAKDGLHGLADLGFTIDPTTKLATLDTAKLDAVLASNKQGVVDTVQEFSANFAKSAALLTSAGNFISNRLANLDRVIHYIADNKSALQAEFGLGDAAKPSGQVAQALAAYNQTYGV